MDITEVRVSLVNHDKVKARVTIAFDDCFVVRDLRIIQGNHNLFVAFPTRRKPDGGYQDVCHPIDVVTRQRMEAAILGRYHEMLERRGDSRRDQDGRFAMSSFVGSAGGDVETAPADDRRGDSPQPGLHIGL